ncbi:MAG: hypothetical protein ABWZ42_00930, partial [Ilumatobacteraceae bacterium]
DPRHRRPVPAPRRMPIARVHDAVEPIEDEVDLGVEIHGVFAQPVPRANDAVHPPTSRAERCLCGRERLGSDPDAVDEHDVGAVIGVSGRTHVGDWWPMDFDTAVSPSNR